MIPPSFSLPLFPSIPHPSHLFLHCHLILLAETQQQADEIALAVEVSCESQGKPLLTIADAIEAGSYFDNGSDVVQVGDVKGTHVCIHSMYQHVKHGTLFHQVKGTIQWAPHMRVISVYFRLNLCKLYDRPIRLLADHNFTVRCIQVESIAQGRWMVPLRH